MNYSSESIDHDLSMMERLKQNTQVYHRQIEKIDSMKRLFAKDYTLLEYKLHLIKLYGFLSVIEPLLLTILKDHELNSFFTHRSNRYLYLMEDLAALGLTAMDIAWLARYNNQIPISDTYQALGVYYVLEGSTLGGQIICQQLTKQFANEIQNKLHFYHGYGQNTQTYWQQFSQIMNHHFRHSHLTDQKLAIQTAQITFEQLRLWLNKE